MFLNEQKVTSVSKAAVLADKFVLINLCAPTSCPEKTNKQLRPSAWV